MKSVLTGRVWWEAAAETTDWRGGRSGKFTTLLVIEEEAEEEVEAKNEGRKSLNATAIFQTQNNSLFQFYFHVSKLLNNNSP